MKDKLLQVKDLSAGYPGRTVVSGLSFEAGAGETVALMGPNGCGKTTLLRSVCGIIAPVSGEILLNDSSVRYMDRREIARKVAFVPQLSEPLPGFTVEEIVFMGREPYKDLFSMASKDDAAAVAGALKRTGSWEIRERDVSELSGGEYQRILIARALAQGTDMILLDEPTAHLDLRHQIDVLTLLNNMNDKLVIAVMHDLHLTKKYFGRAVLLKDGKVHDDGIPPDILNAVNIKEVFGVNES